MRLCVVCLLCLGFFEQHLHAAETTKVDWAHPESIDPFREDIGDFLDVNVREYLQKAYDAYHAGNYEEAARYYLLQLRHDIRDASSIYNLACCYGLLGEATLATQYLKRAVRAGFDNIEHIKYDPDFDNVRGIKVFDAVVDSIALQIEKEQVELGEVMYFDVPTYLKCWVHLPEDYDPEKKYRLVVGLHGYGSNSDRFIALWERFGKPDFIYAVPQAPYPFPVGKKVGYSWGLGETAEDELTDKTSTMSEDYIITVIQNLKQQYSVAEIYLLGFSQGCAFTYSTGIKNYQLFDGLICFGGWLDIDWVTEESIATAKDLRIFIAHGKGDNTVKYEEGLKAKEMLAKQGFNVTFHEFEGGHTVSEEALKEVETWLKK